MAVTFIFIGVFFFVFFAVSFVVFLVFGGDGVSGFLSDGRFFGVSVYLEGCEIGVGSFVGFIVFRSRRW